MLLTLAAIAVAADSPRFAVPVGERWGFINRRGDLVIPAIYDQVGSMSDGRAAVQTGERWGFVDARGRMVVPAIYRRVSYFSEGVAAVQRPDLLWGYVDTQGHPVGPAVYLDAAPFSEGMAAVQCENGRFGFINLMGEQVVPCRYRTVGAFHDGRAGVTEVDVELLWNHWRYSFDASYIDTTGRVVFSLTLSHPMPSFSEGVLLIAADGKGNKIVPQALDPAGTVLWEGPVLRRDSGLGEFHDGLAKVHWVSGGCRETTREMFLKRDGTWASELGWWEARRYSEGFAAVHSPAAVVHLGWASDLEEPENLWGMVDASGRYVVSPRFTALDSLSDGLAWAEVGEAGGFVNRHGDWVIDPVWWRPKSGWPYFKDGLAWVGTNYGFRGVWINRQGRVVWPPEDEPTKLP